MLPLRTTRPAAAKTSTSDANANKRDDVHHHNLVSERLETTSGRGRETRNQDWKSTDVRLSERNTETRKADLNSDE